MSETQRLIWYGELTYQQLWIDWSLMPRGTVWR